MEKRDSSDAVFVEAGRSHRNDLRFRRDDKGFDPIRAFFAFACLVVLNHAWDVSFNNSLIKYGTIRCYYVDEQYAV